MFLFKQKTWYIVIVGRGQDYYLDFKRFPIINHRNLSPFCSLQMFVFVSVRLQYKLYLCVLPTCMTVKGLGFSRLNENWAIWNKLTCSVTFWLVVVSFGVFCWMCRHWGGKKLDSFWVFFPSRDHLVSVGLDSQSSLLLVISLEADLAWISINEKIVIQILLKD